tara:strand:- start:710 stop:880 length:171 start_codon:yes stop_codon:yes gene_type:complete
MVISYAVAIWLSAGCFSDRKTIQDVGWSARMILARCRVVASRVGSAAEPQETPKLA